MLRNIVQAGLQAFTLGLKRQAGAPRTHTLLKHFIENADALQRIVLERKNGNSTPLKQARAMGRGWVGDRLGLG